jgi:hypothetical protein
MKRTNLWKALSGRLFRERSPKSDQAICCVAGEHHGRLIAVASNDQVTIMMCMRHAMAWSDSDLCRDLARNNSGACLKAMALWASEANAVTTVAA